MFTSVNVGYIDENRQWNILQVFIDDFISTPGMFDVYCQSFCGLFLKFSLVNNKSLMHCKQL